MWLRVVYSPWRLTVEAHSHWNAKLVWYREQGILPLEEGGGAKGILITSYDSEQGGIESDEVAGLVKQVFKHQQ